MSLLFIDRSNTEKKETFDVGPAQVEKSYTHDQGGRLGTGTFPFVILRVNGKDWRFVYLLYGANAKYSQSPWWIVYQGDELESAKKANSVVAQLVTSAATVKVNPPAESRANAAPAPAAAQTTGPPSNAAPIATPAAAPTSDNQNATPAAVPLELKEGMTPEEVKKLMGEPQDTLTIKGSVVYIYPTVKVIFENGKLVDVQYQEKQVHGAAASRAAGEVVVAGFQTLDHKNIFLVPILIYDGSHYKFVPRQLPDEDPMIHPVDSRYPNSPSMRELIRKSVLSRAKHFDVYRKGKKIGSFILREAVLSGPFGQVVGIGTATGFTPSYDDIAIAGAPAQPDFWLPASSLSLAQTRQLESLLANLFPKALPRNSVAAAAAGQPIRLRTKWENLNVLDPERNGNLVVCLERTAAVISTGPLSFTARAFLLARYDVQAKKFDKLASWAIISKGIEEVFSNGTVDESLSTFKSAVDLTGDGVPELILLRGIPGGSPLLLVYEFQNGKLRPIDLRAWEVGFEVTTPETISG